MAMTFSLLPKNTLLRIYLGTTSAILILLLIVWNTASFLPHSKTIRQLFLVENSLLEFIALSLLGLAMLLAAAALVRQRKSQLYSLYWWLFPLGIFALICDETSFGRVYYPWYTPIKICGTKFDALHDLLVILPHCLPYLGISKGVFVLTLLLFLVGAFIFALHLTVKHKILIVTSLKTNPVWVYLAFAFVLFWLGGGLEVLSEVDVLKIGESSILVFLEESFEMLAEYTVFFAALVFFLKK